MEELDSKILKRYHDALGKQVQQAIARHIRTKVRDARSDPDRAARRWPFELIQNAHDAGERQGRDGISVSFEHVNDTLIFTHDAAPFIIADIAGLLTGGSSKDFLSSETTGRFGTGFLVTHSLSERIQVAGILDDDGGFRSFEVELYRPDDDEQILSNIQESETALGRARHVTNFDHEPTARFQYVTDDSQTVRSGLASLKASLPFLFGSCRRLRKVEIQSEGCNVSWLVDARNDTAQQQDVFVHKVSVRQIDDSERCTKWEVLRATTGETNRGWLLLALKKATDGWAVVNPDGIPRIFRQLPLIGSHELDIWVVIDGDFDVDQDRSNIHIVGESQAPLAEAFDALPGLALLGIRKGWENGHRIGQLSVPTGQGHDATEAWEAVLSHTAKRLGQLPLVMTNDRNPQPVEATKEGGSCADFIATPTTGLTHRALWELAAECKKLLPPGLEISEHWSAIAKGWEELGVTVKWLGLEEIGEWASNNENVDSMVDLAIDADPYDWLTRYLDLVGKSWSATGSTKKSLVKGLLPDQTGKLHGYGELQWDAGVSEELKNIAAQIAFDLRGQLVDQALVRFIKERNLNAAAEAVKEATGTELDEEEAIRDVVRRLGEALPADHSLAEEDQDAASASIKLLKHLWKSQGIDAEPTAWEVPLLAHDGTVCRAGRQRMLMLPVNSWPESAKPFADVFPPSRILSDDYAKADEGELLNALTIWGISHRGIVAPGSRRELRDRALHAIAANPDEVADARLLNCEFAQISLLEPEVINYCKQSRELAQALLGLVVCYVAQNDTSWRSSVEVSVRTQDGERTVRVTPSLWLADLRSKPWIPVEGDDDITHHIPNPGLIRELIDPVWLADSRDGADLLVQHFNMDALDVRLLAAGSDESARQRIRDGLARIVEWAGYDPEAIENLAASAEQRTRHIERIRKLGLAVQERVKTILEQFGLQVEDVDRGYDYLVTGVEIHEDDAGEPSAQFKVGKYKVEVKATRTDEVRLTPLQATTASEDPDSFVLCVVDLRTFQGEVDDVNWAEADIGSWCRLVTGSAMPINETLALIHDAEGTDVPIRNIGALRYGVGVALWEEGLTLEGWVQDRFAIGENATTANDK